MSGYIGNIPTPQATQSRQSFTATASQTTFATVGYTAGFIDVYLNGVHLLDGTDYTATNGSDIVLTTGAALDDVVEFVAYETFSVLDQSFTGTTTVDVLSVTGAATGTDLTLSGGLYVGGAVAANYLDDYETGTWTPALEFGNASVGMTYTAARDGFYTKVGNLVNASCYFVLTSKGTSTGTAKIKDLPFTSTSTVYTLDAASFRLQSVSFADSFMGYQPNGTTEVVLEEITNAGAQTALTDANFANNSQVMMSVTYRV
jgi:hypothetical protein